MLAAEAHFSIWDGIRRLTAIVPRGGLKREAEVTAAADEHGSR